MREGVNQRAAWLCEATRAWEGGGVCFGAAGAARVMGDREGRGGERKD